MPNICRTILTLTIILFFYTVKGQITPDSVIRVSSIQNNYLISPSQYRISIVEKPVSSLSELPDLDYQPVYNILPLSGKIRGNVNSRYIYVKLTLVNFADSSRKIFLYPGHYFKSYHLYQQCISRPEEITALPPMAGPGRNGDAYRAVVLAPKESIILYALFQPVKIQVNTFRPEMVHPSFLALHFEATKSDNESLNILTFILVGILGMMIIFSFSNYLFNRKREFLYYSLYALSTAIILFLKTQLYLSTSHFNYFFEEYLDFMLLLTGLLFYTAFLRKFLSIDRSRYPFLNKVITTAEVLVIAFGLVYSFLYFSSDSITGLELMEMVMKYIIVAVGIFFVVAGLKQRNRLMNYIVYGNACIIVFGLISMLITVSPVSQDTVLTHALFYYELGIIGEFSFFLLGLTYKNRMELIEKTKQEEALIKKEEKQEFEKQLNIMNTLQDERNRISADMHDELGGGMTAIRLLSELAKQRTNDTDLPEIEKISSSANDLLGKMNAIIWSMKASNDTLENLITYIKSFTHEFSENHHIQYTIQAPEQTPEIEVTGVKRRNIFLAYKEVFMALRNLYIPKADVQVTIVDNTITIKIAYTGGNEKLMKENIESIINRRMKLIDGTTEIVTTDMKNYTILRADL